MKKNEIEAGSLYLTYDSHRRVLHVSRAGQGTPGFLQYIRSDMTDVLQKGYDPNLWMTHFEFPDKRDIPPIDPNAMENYFETLRLAAQQCGVQSCHTVSMTDAFYCLDKGIAPLTPDADRYKLAQRKDYAVGPNNYGTDMPQPNALLPEYRAYQALQTEQGVMLFSCTPEGERQRQAYELYHEIHFYSPSSPGGKLTYHQIIALPDKLHKQVDRFTPQTAQGPAKGFKDLYADKNLISQGRITREYDLTQTAENYETFRRRDQVGSSLQKGIFNKTLRELWDHFVEKSLRTPDERNLLCVESRNFPAEQRETTFKMKH